MILYALGIPFYIWARKEQKGQIFNTVEIILAVLAVGCGIYASYLLAIGTLSLA